MAPLMEGLGAARTARRLASLVALLGRVGTGPHREQARRKASMAGFLTAVAARRSVQPPAPRAGAPDVLGILGLDQRDESHAALLAWALDRDAEHGLGDGFAAALFQAMGVARPPGPQPVHVRRDGAVVHVTGASGAVAITMTRPPRAVRPTRRSLRPGVAPTVTPGVVPWLVPGAGPGVTPSRDGGSAPGPAAWGLGYDVLLDVLGSVATQARPDGAMLLAAWARCIARGMLGRTTMTDWKGYSPDVRYLLEHWQEYLDVVAVREQLDREFTQARLRVLDAVRARYPVGEGWDATLDEDWILLRRKDWPIPAEEWLAFVVVMTDVESVMTEGRDGWWSAVSLPTDGDFDADIFAALVRKRLDPAAWRAHTAQKWPGHALGRNLPRLGGSDVLAGEMERVALDELARYVQLVPSIDQALRDMG